VLCWAIVLGPVAGIAGVLFTGLMTAARLHAPTGLRSVGTITAVFAGLGALAIGYPQLLGNGKGMAALALDGTLGLGLAGLLLVLKPIATAACLGAGAIGGLLTPSLATGAALGVFTGRLWSLLWPGAPLVAYAVVGAAALLAVTLRAPVTAVVLTLEFVRTAQALLVPMLVGVALATGTASMLRRYRAGRTRLASDTTRPGHRGP
jgi:H+/Cl- antiporter ClcA